MEARVTDVAQDDRPCPVCTAPIGGDRRALALMPDGVRWGHAACLLSGKATNMRPRLQEVAACA